MTLRHIISALLAFAVVGSATVGSAHEFTTCKNQHGDPLGVQSVIFTPDPPRSGRPVTVAVKGVPSVDVSDGKLRVDIRVLGVTVDSQVMDLCTLVQCPLVAGQEFEGTVSQDIPEGTPDHMGATVRLTLVRGTGQTVTCLESRVEISGDKDTPLLQGSESGEQLKKDAQFLFNKWKAQWPKAVHNLEVFRDNLRKILTHNKNKDKTYTMALNEFGSLTEEEFVKTRLGVRMPDSWVKKSLRTVMTILPSNPFQADPPKEVDWTTKGVVTPVKNQGACGSCWAFSAIGALESAYALKNNRLVSFSEQQLVSCDGTDYGCQGGWMDNAFDFLSKSSGICTEEEYPYSSGVNSARGDCLVNQCTPVPDTVPKGFVDVATNEAAMAAAVALNGPLSVAVEADQAAFQFYHTGVVTGTCGTHLNHGVLIVGYGIDQATGTPYWKVKNSWGPGWGEAGYIRIQRGKRWPTGGECGISSHPSYPIF